MTLKNSIIWELVFAGSQSTPICSFRCEDVFYFQCLDVDREGVMDKLMEALKTGQAFASYKRNKGRKRAQLDISGEYTKEVHIRTSRI